LTVPREIRDAAGSAHPRQSLDENPRSVTWIIEVASQVIFSASAAVHFEIFVGRDERSVDLGFYSAGGTGHGAPGKPEDHKDRQKNKSAHPKGIYSKAVRLAVDDTTSLWNSPAFPTWEGEEDGKDAGQTKEQVLDDQEDKQQKQDRPSKRKRKVHLVIVTHGIHSNVGADMLFLKESIDATAKQAREDARMRKAQMKAAKLRQEKETQGDPRSMSTPELAVAPTLNPGEDDKEEEDDDDEQVIVRGFGENVVRTERGIQYLGKRLAKYVLSMTYPHQPYLPVKSSISKTIARSLAGQKPAAGESSPAHKNSSIRRDEEPVNKNLAYQITSISFVGHSLGGLTQTYAIAYIKKHSPDFFDLIKPINFIAMASPFLGLSNENPIYVKFALDFGLVGRTGQDLGLTWRAPTMVRSGWGAMIGGLGSEAQKNKTVPDPGAKPLLRVLPTGPAHAALKLFRNRSVYSNVVNDGIVPLRTSCLLFLDWRGLGRVEKARRDNGIVGTMVGWGWAEMMGQNASSPKAGRPWADFFNDSGEESDAKKKTRQTDHRNDVPQPDEEAMNEDNVSAHNVPIEPKPSQFINGKPFEDEAYGQQKAKAVSSQQASTAWSGFLSLFRPQTSSKSNGHPRKSSKIYHRGQTTSFSQDTDSDSADNTDRIDNPRKPLVRGPSLYMNNSATEDVEAPPRTTFFESAGDVLKPPLPSKEFIIDPAARPRTIFHDRIYHPQDIPPPAVKQTRSLVKRSISCESVTKPCSKTPSPSLSTTNNSNLTVTTHDTSDMKIEEKIARAYHRDLSWRKVLVRLEPDAHNNMIVRRMFANAYGWPVIKHMCDTHFGFTASATTDDALEENVERVKATEEQASPGEAGEQVTGQMDPPSTAGGEVEDRGRQHGLERRMSEADTHSLERITSPDLERLKRPHKRTDSEIREATDEVPDLGVVASATADSSMNSSASKPTLQHRLSRQDSGRWSDGFFDGSDDDDDHGSDVDFASSSPSLADRARSVSGDTPTGTTEAEIADILSTSRHPPATQQQRQYSPEGEPKPLITQKFTAPPRPLRSPDGGDEVRSDFTATSLGEERTVPKAKVKEKEKERAKGRVK
jgi:Putative serine esterase (DUF676)